MLFDQKKIFFKRSTKCIINYIPQPAVFCCKMNTGLRWRQNYRHYGMGSYWTNWSHFKTSANDGVLCSGLDDSWWSLRLMALEGDCVMLLHQPVCRISFHHPLQLINNISHCHDTLWYQWRQAIQQVVHSCWCY